MTVIKLDRINKNIKLIHIFISFVIKKVIKE
jgi:hypothetical protein